MNTSDKIFNNVVVGNSNTAPGSITVGTGSYNNNSTGIGGLRTGFIELIAPDGNSGYLSFTNSHQLIFTSNVMYLGQNGGESAVICNEIFSGGTNTGSTLLRNNRILVLGNNSIPPGNTVLQFN